MTPQPLLVSIIIGSYNYERFLNAAIDSALQQTYPHVEVIVVDDGSTDDSPAIIRAYGDAVRAIFKPNGGQPSSVNAGFAASRGDLIMFLDSDDVLLPDVAERVVAAYRPGVSQIQSRLQVIDAQGVPTGEYVPPLSRRMPNGSVLDVVLRGQGYPGPSTSGLAYPRAVLERMMPIPEAVWPTYVDVYQLTIAAFLGTMVSLEAPGAQHRIHGHNMWAFGLESLEVEQLVRYTEPIFLRASLIREWAEREGHAVGPHLAFQYPGEIARMMTLKRKAPDHPRFKDLSRAWFMARGLRAVLDDPFPPAVGRRLGWAAWFVLMACLPQGPAMALAERSFLGRRQPATPLAPRRA